MLKNKNRGKKQLQKELKYTPERFEQCPKLKGKFKLVAERS